MLSKAKRLTVKEIEALSHGISVFSTLISLRMVKADTFKCAVVVSKKVAKTAVVRNRIRRRVYALVEKIYPDITLKAHVMLMPKKEFYDEEITKLEQALRDLFVKARLI